ncbi:MAG TPA: acetyl-CoA C-acetyltransferase [Thermopetrobacter sp.]|nr:acetyl-CoA C-acetyltransferase [Thermopetrobacter sp.]
MEPVVIAAAARTPVGAFNGALAALAAQELGAVALKAAAARTGIDPADIDEAILGQVLNATGGQNPPRQAALAAGMRQESTAWGMNQVCGSGLRAVALAMQQIALGEAAIVAAGGMESMSNAPHAAHLRSGVRMGEARMVDTMVHDGLWDAFNDCHMGITAENVAERWQIGREEQDAFAVASQHKAAAARRAGRFREEIAPVTISTRKGETVVDEDEYIREGVTLDDLARLRPVFRKDGTVTAGNASGINDGAAALILMSEGEAEKRGLTPLARIVAWGQSGVDPAIMGIGPVAASRRALEKAGWGVDDLDLVEANEAFAAQAIAVNREMGWDEEIVNVNGGAIAIGHPIGASGARILTTLLHEMRRREARRGLATLCIGGGMGVALCVERG